MTDRIHGQLIRWTRFHPTYNQGRYMMYRSSLHITQDSVHTFCGLRIPHQYKIEKMTLQVSTMTCKNCLRSAK